MVPVRQEVIVCMLGNPEALKTACAFTKCAVRARARLVLKSAVSFAL